MLAFWLVCGVASRCVVVATRTSVVVVIHTCVAVVTRTCVVVVIQ